MTLSLRRKTNNHKAFVRMETGDIISERSIRQAWFATGDDLMRTSNDDILHGKKTGRVYRIRRANGRYVRHQSSAPGESHANLTGALRRSRSWKVRGMFLDFGYGVVTKAPRYANWVENGNRRMEPRPTLKNSVNKNIGKTQVNIMEAHQRDWSK